MFININFISLAFIYTKLHISYQRMQPYPCQEHSIFSGDTICYHPDCIALSQQLTCSQCVTCNGLHSTHDQFLEPFHIRSPTFKLIASSGFLELKIDLSQEKRMMMEFFQRIESQIMGEFNRWKEKQLKRMDCHIKFYNKSAIPKILMEIKKEPAAHVDCCLRTLNLLYDLNRNGQSNNQSVYNVINEATLSHFKGTLKKGGNLKQILAEMLENKDYDNINLGNDDFILQIQQKAKNLQQFLKKDYSVKLSGSEVQLTFDSFSPKSVLSSFDNHEDIDKNKTINNLNKAIEQPNQEFLQAQLDLVPKHLILNHQNKKQKIAPKTKIISKKLVRSRANYGRQEYPIEIDEGIIQKKLNFIEKQVKILQSTVIASKIKQNMHGVQIIKDLMIIWNGDKWKQIIESISKNSSIKYLIIYDTTIAIKLKLIQILETNENIKGINLHCENIIKLKDFQKFHLQFLNCFQSSRFMQLTDNSIYFPKSKLSCRQLPMPIQQKSESQSKVHSLQSYTAIKKNQLSKIPKQTKQLNILQVNENNTFIGYQKIWLNFKVYTQLQILTFSNVKLNQKAKNYSLRIIFKNNQNLHTLTFCNCQCKLTDVILQFSQINVDKLQNLNITADQSSNKENISLEAFQIVCRLVNLKTLILVNIQLSQTKIKKQSSIDFRSISSLSALTHLNLYKSQPVYSDFLEYLHPATHSALTTINIGHTKVNSSAVYMLSKLVSLQALVLDCTELGGRDLQIITQNMNNLQKLSIQNLNGAIISHQNSQLSTKQRSYGQVLPIHLENLLYKKLRYVNIIGCSQLRDFNWTGFQNLECLKIHKGQLSFSIKKYLVLKNVNVLVEKRFNIELKIGINIKKGKTKGNREASEKGQNRLKQYLAKKTQKINAVNISEEDQEGHDCDQSEDDSQLQANKQSVVQVRRMSKRRLAKMMTQTSGSCFICNEQTNGSQLKQPCSKNKRPEFITKVPKMSREKRTVHRLNVSNAC